MSVPKRALGSQGLIVSAIGLGCMGMTAFYGDFDRASSEEESLRTIEVALDRGVNFFDTAWIYQSFGTDGKDNTTNEELLGKAINKFGREKFVIATKFGIYFGEQGIAYSGKADLIRSQLNDSLRRLGIECVDLYYQHRMDPTTPIEETIACLAELVKEGKIKYIGLSECTPDELRRAHAVHPITAIQMEWSLQTRDFERSVLPVARELGIGIVPYSPLGRGLLTGRFSSTEDLSEKDWRRSAPRFSAENFSKNAAVGIEFAEYAKKKGCTGAQLALAWLYSKGADIFPIPGTRSSTRIAENCAALSIRLSCEEVLEIESIVSEGIGDRYPPESMSATFNNRL